MVSNMISGVFRKRKIRPWLLPPLPGESADDTEERRQQAYFDEQRENSLEWLHRMDLGIDVSGLRVLDLGCGHGALSISFAELGAAEVVGLDLDKDRIAFATRNLGNAFPQFRDRVRFLCEDVRNLKLDEYYDLIVSKDAFEHIDDLTDVVNHLNRLLKPGGCLAPGFSPLYYSPFGDHNRFAVGLPWLHAILPESLLVWWLNVRTGSNVSSSMDLGLNKLTPRQFRWIFEKRPTWEKVDIKYNCGDKRLLHLFNIMRLLPFLEKYFTAGIYAVAKKTVSHRE